jgi:hypothetical protein
VTTVDSPPDFGPDDLSTLEPNPFHTEPPAPEEIDTWQPIDLTTLPDEPPVQPTLGKTGSIGILYPGKRHVFSGPPESAKTIAAYILTIQVIRDGGSAVLVDFEMGSYDARRRLYDLGATPQELRAGLHYISPNDPATPDRIQRLVDLQPRLVTIDAAAGAYDLEGLDDNKRADVEKLSRLYVTAFWRAGISTLFVDHVGKNTETRGRFVIGSERKLGGADVHIGFETITPISRGTKGLYKIITHKDRGGYLKRGHFANLDLSSDPDSHAITWTFKGVEGETTDTGTFRPTHLMEKVSAWLELQHEPVTRNEITDAIGGTKDYVLKAITALRVEGFTTEDDGPRRSKLVRSIRPYREDDPTCNPQNDPTGSVVRSGSAVVREPDDASGSSGSLSPRGATTEPPSSTHDRKHTTGSTQTTIPQADPDIPF